MDDSEEVGELLDQWREGDESAYDRLIPLVYADLRRLARGHLRGEAAGHSLQPTLLVHEAYLRLVDAEVNWQNRTHFLSVAARVMRRILVERARAVHASKRGGDAVRVTLTSQVEAPTSDPVDILRLDAALRRLERLDARQASAVDLCYFGGFTYPEIGKMLNISEATVHRDLRHARAWLRIELDGSSHQDG
jgi:RNA polymerase sigma factor (TIGR02999 family)